MGYTGYFIPIHFTETQFSQWMEAGSFDLSRSVVLMDGEAPAGFSFLGVRGRRGWVGGFGICPDCRGKGLAYQLFEDHIHLCLESGLESVQLEVLVENWAQRVYSRAGFAVTRRLSNLHGRLTQAGGNPPVHEGNPRPLLTHSARLHEPEGPVWQREPDSLEVSMPPSAGGLYTGPEGLPTGFLLYQAAPDRV